MFFLVSPPFFAAEQQKVFTHTRLDEFYGTVRSNSCSLFMLLHFKFVHTLNASCALLVYFFLSNLSGGFMSLFRFSRSFWVMKNYNVNSLLHFFPFRFGLVVILQKVWFRSGWSIVPPWRREVFWIIEGYHGFIKPANICWRVACWRKNIVVVYHMSSTFTNKMFEYWFSFA